MKFSSAERQHIIDATNATLARGEAGDQREREQVYLAAMREDALEEALAQPSETRNQRDRRELQEQEQRFAGRLSTGAEQTAQQADSAPDVELRIASAIADERELQRELLAHVIVELDQRREKAIDAAVIPLQAELSKLKAEFAEAESCELTDWRSSAPSLRGQLCCDRSKVIEDCRARCAA